jgi:hypothetical protein
MGGAAAEPVTRLHPLGVLREALVVYRRHSWGLMAAAFVIFAPLALLDGALEIFEAETPVTRVLERIAAALLHLLGDVFYAGLVATAVIAWRRGGGRQRPIDVARALPWGTIIALDFLLAFGTAVLLVALIVPGVWFYTVFSLAPAVAKIEHLGVRRSMGRSRELVRGNFWRVLAVMVIVVGGAALLEELVQLGVETFVGNAVAHLAVQTLTVPIYGLVTVLMAFHLRGDGQ